MSRAQLLADVRAMRHYLGELLPSIYFEGNSVIANVLSSIEGIAMKIPEEDEVMINTPTDLDKDGIKALEVIKKFLAERGVDDDGNDSKVFWSPAEWKAKNEKYGEGAVLIVMYDGSHVRNVFSMDACYEIGCMIRQETGKSVNAYEPYEALQAALNEEGFFFEECTGWYAAVYKD